MTIYKTRRAAESYGQAIGILLLDAKAPFIPGDVANASTYAYPVIFKTVEGLSTSVCLNGAPEFNAKLAEGAKELEAAGVRVPAGVTGKSLFQPPKRDAVFLERERHANVRAGNLSYPVRGVRTKEFLYLRNLEPDRWPAGDPEFVWSVGPYGDIDDSPTKRLLMQSKQEPYFSLCMGKRAGEELYELKSDPGQVRNVAGEARFAVVKARLAARVDAWMLATGDPRAKGRTAFWDDAPYTGPRFRGAPPR